MTNSQFKIVSLIAILVLVLLGIAAQFITVQEAGVNSSQIYTANSGELTGEAAVGQTFVSRRDHLSGVAVMLATYSNRNNTAPVKFELRESLRSQEALREATVHPRELRDNQFYRFKFESIAEAKDKTFFFLITSPEGVKGNAVTVDINTQDPYHQGTAFLSRSVGRPFTGDILARSGKQTLDVVFTTYHDASLAMAAYHQVRDVVINFIVTWDEQRGLYLRWLILLAPVVFFAWIFRSKKAGGYPLMVLGIIMAAGLLWRLWYLPNMPVTNDEGNYLYDAWAMRQGILAGGDGYVKAPLVIAWISLWQFILGNSIEAGRVASVMAGVLTCIPMYLIGKYLLSNKAGLVAAGAWALMGAPAVFTIYAHTQPLAVFFGTMGVALCVIGVRKHKYLIRKVEQNETGLVMKWFIWSGVFLGLGVASRKSVLALGLIPLWLILAESRSWKQRAVYLLGVGFSFLVVIAAFLGLAWFLYGEIGIWEALGLNSAEDGLSGLDSIEQERAREYSLRGMTPFFREALPLLWMGLVGMGIALEKAFQKLIKIDNVSKFVWVLPVWVFVWAWGFFFEYDGGIFVSIGAMPVLWWILFILMLMIAAWPRWRKKEEASKPEVAIPHSRQPNVPVRGLPNVEHEAVHTEDSRVETFMEKLSLAMVPMLWLGGLVFFYVNWIKFHANYIVEFLVPLCVATGVAGVLVWQQLDSFKLKQAWMDVTKRIVVLSVLGVVLWAGYLANYITWHFEHTGTFSKGSLEQAAEWARENIPSEETIFTGAAAVPYLSGHHTALDIAHPRWYAYQFTRENTERLSTFLPSAEEMLNAYRQAQWFMLERQTGFSFLMEYSEIEAGLERDWVPVQEIENGSNTLTFYRRVR